MMLTPCWQQVAGSNPGAQPIRYQIQVERVAMTAVGSVGSAKDVPSPQPAMTSAIRDGVQHNERSQKSVYDFAAVR
jgi:hypothetical protein